MLDIPFDGDCSGRWFDLIRSEGRVGEYSWGTNVRSYGDSVVVHVSYGV